MSNYPIENEEENRFAATDEEAALKYEEYKLKDPFPDIPPALLNSRDIKRYVAATGMIHPFHPKPEKDHMKQASYAVKMLGRCIYWDEEGKKYDIDLEEKQEFLLKGNSIAFVSLEPTFRIPYYIALRFNLKIKHIHRGILLGTGPLVDPGFNGKLAVPLHNLTMNDYVLRGGDDLIWFEFTKINLPQNARGDKAKTNDKSEPLVLKDYIEFRPDKNIKDINDYLHKAYNGQPIRSSLSEIQKIAEEAKKRTRIIQWTGIFSFLALLLTLVFTIFIPIHSLVTDTINYIKVAKKENQELISEQAKRIGEFETKLKSLGNIIEGLEKKITQKDERLKVPEKSLTHSDEKTETKKIKQ